MGMLITKIGKIQNIMPACDMRNYSFDFLVMLLVIIMDVLTIWVILNPRPQNSWVPEPVPVEPGRNYPKTETTPELL